MAEPGKVEVMSDALCNAKIEAITVREGIEKLSKLEKTVGAKQLAAVLRLIEAVEAI